MSYRPRYERGDWKAVCDICGREFKATRLRKRWDGFMVCNEDWEPRHPQDFVRGVVDTQVPSWTRPETQDKFAAVYGPIQQSGVVGYGIVGFMVVGKPFPVWFSNV